jgi:hypothetical protein
MRGQCSGGVEERGMSRVASVVGSVVAGAVVLAVAGGVTWCDYWSKRLVREQQIEQVLRDREAKERRAAADAGGSGERSGSAPQFDAQEQRPQATRSADDGRLANLDAEIERLSAELDRLRRELAAAREELRGGDVRRRQMADHLAANPLVHAELWRDLYEAVLDGETVTADPARVLAPMLALARATGVANGERVEGARHVRPEPSAPECELRLVRNDDRWQEGEGAAARAIESRGVSFEVRLELPKKPDGWRGGQLTLSVSLNFDRRSDGASFFRIDIDGPGSVGGSDSEIHLSIDPSGGGSIWRKPHQGDLDAHDLAPGEFHDLQQKLIAAYEELRTLAG